MNTPVWSHKHLILEALRLTVIFASAEYSAMPIGKAV